jgi:hypothetical protein
VEAQQDLSISCIQTIIKGLDLLRYNRIPSDRFPLIAGGTYRLLPYALDFWIHHCLVHADQSGGIKMENPLLDKLQQLCNKHDEQKPTIVNATSPDSRATTSSKLDGRLVHFINHPIHGIMRSVLNARFEAGQSQCENGEGE